MEHCPSLGRHYAQMVRVAVNNCFVDTDANQPRPEMDEKPDVVLIRVSVLIFMFHTFSGDKHINLVQLNMNNSINLFDYIWWFVIFQQQERYIFAICVLPSEVPLPCHPKCQQCQHNEQSMSIPRRGGGQVPNRRLSLATLHSTATDACLPVLLGRPCLWSDNSVGGRVAHGSLPTLAHCRHCNLMKWNRLTGRI